MRLLSSFTWQAGATTLVVGVAVGAIYAADRVNLKQLTASLTGQQASEKQVCQPPLTSLAVCTVAAHHAAMTYDLMGKRDREVCGHVADPALQVARSEIVFVSDSLRAGSRCMRGEARVPRRRPRQRPRRQGPRCATTPTVKETTRHGRRKRTRRMHLRR
jgi:hypothetical protein